MKNLELGILPTSTNTQRFYFACWSWFDKRYNAESGYFKELFKFILYEEGFDEFVTTQTWSDEMMRSTANELYYIIKRIEVDEYLESLYNAK